jgi:putative ABC transport system permease protein
VSFATILGVATGMCVVTAILIVDHNTARSYPGDAPLTEAVTVGGAGGAAPDAGAVRLIELPITRIDIVKQGDFADPATTLLSSRLPTQQVATPVSADAAPGPQGEEDYQTMRLAVRMASMFAFFIGSVIVFYTMRFSVAMRIREFALFLCLGEHRRNVCLSLIVESLILGAMGTVTGMLAALPMARVLLLSGISTTGRVPSSVFAMPYAEVAIMALISLLIVLLGVISPVKTIYRFPIAQVLQPRFMEGDIRKSYFKYTGYSWLIPPMLLASWLAVRPFLENWLSVVYFFLLEAVFITVLTLATIWLTRPFLRFCIRLIEMALKRLLPLETLLTVRRIRLTSHKFVFSITGVMLVFSLLISLHAITHTLKSEIFDWSSEALSPYFFYKFAGGHLPTATDLEQLEMRHGLHIFRLSEKVRGALPIRLISARDFNRYRSELGLPPFASGQVIFSRTLAARYGVQVGDFLRISTASAQHDFEVTEISDAVGTFAENAQYVDIKSFALFSDGNPLFRDNLELTLGQLAVSRSSHANTLWSSQSQRDSLLPHYRYVKSGRLLEIWQLDEIDDDFLIFDFILFMTVVLAFIGILNTLLMQIHSRSRELSILITLGIDRVQLFRLLLVEGLVIGLVGAVLAVMLGSALGMVSVSFLDQFTLFQYDYSLSAATTLLLAGFAVFTCCVSAIYPALVATRISTAESLHYE